MLPALLQTPETCLAHTEAFPALGDWSEGCHKECESKNKIQKPAEPGAGAELILKAARDRQLAAAK